jgi:hypothetical protein
LPSVSSSRHTFQITLSNRFFGVPSLGVIILCYGTLNTPYTAITRSHSNNEPLINIVVKFIQMDDRLFKWMKNCQFG